MTEKKAKKIDQIKVTQIKSTIGQSSVQRKNLIGLGLTKLGKSKVLANSDAIQGMVKKVKHLISVEKL
ncbi:MAG: 50S ribosomal protein L30 [Rickettsiaceae bacterium]